MTEPAQMKIDIEKSYRTRDGHEVRIYATDGNGRYPIHGAYLEGLIWWQECWRADGKKYHDGFQDEKDLVTEE